MYRTVYELTKDELNELRDAYFYQVESEEAAEEAGVECPEDIPDSVLFAHYEGISFVKDDFFCNL